jgi:hypothetical protein
MVRSLVDLLAKRTPSLYANSGRFIPIHRSGPSHKLRYSRMVALGSQASVRISLSEITAVSPHVGTYHACFNAWQNMAKFLVVSDRGHESYPVDSE